MTNLILFLCPEIQNVAFFFSVIRAKGRKKSRGKRAANKDGEESNDSGDEELTPSQATSSATHNWISNQVVVKKRFLGHFQKSHFFLFFLPKFNTNQTQLKQIQNTIQVHSSSPKFDTNFILGKHVQINTTHLNFCFVLILC